MMEYRSLIKFTGDTKLEGAVNEPDGCVTTHRFLHRLDKWTNRNIITFKEKYKVLHQGEITAGINICRGLISWKAAFQKRAWGSV